jgi:bifunctional non-homologous end joining protein LigD
MLAGGTGVPPHSELYLFEPKLDGQRIIARVEPDVVTLINRRGVDTTETYPELRGLAAALARHSAVLDGEVVAFNERGETSFQRLQRRMHVARPSTSLLADTPVSFVAFDVLWLDGELLVERPQFERRLVLDRLALKGPSWQVAPVLDATPDELIAACRQLGLEGFMAKRRDAPYVPGGRSLAWWKVKCGRRREFVVGGWSRGHGSRESSIGSLALGCFDVTAEEAEATGRRQRLFYVGQAGSGLNEEMIRQLSRLFARIETPTPPFVNPSRIDLHWVEPLLVVEIAYREITDTGTVRQPSITGLRTDVVAGEVIWDDEIRARFAGLE